MNLVYNIKDKPKFPQLLVFALQQVLAILAATIAVPAIVGNGMSQSAALFGAGCGTIVYQLFTTHGYGGPALCEYYVIGEDGCAYMTKWENNQIVKIPKVKSN